MIVYLLYDIIERFFLFFGELTWLESDSDCIGLVDDGSRGKI
jgi:hypothetical protein